jgi:hypothetical protein
MYGNTHGAIPMKTFNGLLVVLLMAAGVASADEANIETITVTARSAQRVAMDKFIVTALVAPRLTVEKVEPAMPIELPSLDLTIGVVPEA